MTAGTFGNFICRLPEKYKITYLSVKSIYPFIICALLIIASADQQRRPHHCLNRFDGRIRIRARA